MAHTFNLNIQEAEGSGFPVSQASMVYRVNSRTAWEKKKTLYVLKKPRKRGKKDRKKLRY